MRVNRLMNALETFKRGIKGSTAKKIEGASPEQVKAIWNQVSHGDKELEDFIKVLSGGQKKGTTRWSNEGRVCQSGLTLNVKLR